MALNKKISVVAFDKQTAFGTLAANRKYGFGLRSGKLYDAGREVKYEELTTADRFPPSAYIDAALPVVDVVTRAWPRSVVMLLENALGTRVTTGAGDPFLHTITPAAFPGYLTVATRLDTEYHKIRDCRVDTLSFSWTGAAPLEMAVRLMGCVSTLYTSSGNPTTDDSDQQSFYPSGGVFQLDTDSSTPATADITGGTITIANHLSPVPISRQIEPNDVWPGLHEITTTLRMIPATNTNLWRAIITGSDAGTAVSPTPVYGSFHTLFTITAGTRDLDFAASRQAWDGDYPDPDPAGGPVELELTSTVVKPAGDAFTALVHNQDAATNYAGS